MTTILFQLQQERFEMTLQRIVCLLRRGEESIFKGDINLLLSILHQFACAELVTLGKKKKEWATDLCLQPHGG